MLLDKGQQLPFPLLVFFIGFNLGFPSSRLNQCKRNNIANNKRIRKKFSKANSQTIIVDLVTVPMKTRGIAVKLAMTF